MRQRDSWPGELFLGGWRRVAMATATVLVLATGCAKSAGDWNQPPDEVDMTAGGDDLGQGADLSAAADLATGAADLATGVADQSTPGDLATPDLAKVTNCVIVPQSGCPTGLKCTTRDAKTTQCDQPGPDGRGQICTTTNDVDSCVTGTACIDEGMGKSQCRQFCRNDTDCGARSYCMFNLDQAGTFKVCSQPCNAIYPGTSGCAAGLGCYVNAAERTDCKAPGTVGDNQPCTKTAECKPGMVCYGNAGASVCHRICQKGNPAACAGSDDCFPIQSFTSYGICCNWLLGC